jgi:Lipocalin-like domain
MPGKKAPSAGVFLPALLMYFCSGQSMHFRSGVDTMGEEPQGIIMYTPDGYMSAQLMHPGRPKFASGDWFRGSDEEIKEEGLGYIAYSGPFPHGRDLSYRITPTLPIVTIPVDISSSRNGKNLSICCCVSTISTIIGRSNERRKIFAV